MKFEKVEFFIGVIAVLLLSVLAWMFAPAGVTGAVLDAARQRLAMTVANEARVTTQPELPGLPTAWQQLNIDWQHCGLTTNSVTQPDANDPVLFGDAPFWIGEVTGPAGVGTTCLSLAFQRYPLRLESFNVSDHVMTARYRLYGIIAPIVVTAMPATPRVTP